MRAFCVILGFSTLCCAAPIPKNLEPKADIIKRLFGDVIADNDVTFDLLHKSILSASISNKFRKRAFEWNLPFPTLATKEVTGEFEISAKLAMGFDKDAKIATGFDKRVCCSGLLLSAGRDLTSFVGFFHRYELKEWKSGLFMMSKSNRGGSSSTTTFPFEQKPYSIRLTRRDSKVTIETAAEGKPFRVFTTHTFVPQEASISLVHFNTLDGTTTADFEDFLVKPAPELK